MRAYAFNSNSVVPAHDRSSDCAQSHTLSTVHFAVLSQCLLTSGLDAPYTQHTVLTQPV